VSPFTAGAARIDDAVAKTNSDSGKFFGKLDAETSILFVVFFPSIIFATVAERSGEGVSYRDNFA
jgi:hypothetical protein